MKWSKKNAKLKYSGRIITLYKQKVKLPNDAVANLDIIHHPGASAVVPITNDGKIVLVRQYRHAAGGYLYEIPAGTLNKNESPLTCAKRELIEEAGFRAKKFKKLITVRTTPGFTDESIHIYLATKLTPAQTNYDFDEVMSVCTFTKPQVKKMIKKRKITDAKTLVGLLFFLTKF